MADVTTQTVEDWDADLAELRSLQSSATRPRVATMLGQCITTAERQRALVSGVHLARAAADQVNVQQVAADERKAAAAAAAAARAATEPTLAVGATESKGEDRSRITWEKFDKFAWADDGSVVKVWLNGLDGVGASGANVTCNYTATSVDLQIQGYNGRNIRLLEDPLFDTIDPALSKYKVRDNNIVLTLAKKERRTWTTLQKKENKLKKSANADADPSAGLMDMMKQMYEEGDDTMKRTIAEAWTKARSNDVAK